MGKIISNRYGDITSIVNKADRSASYREKLKEATFVSMKRAHDTGFSSNYDDFLCEQGLFLSMPPKERKNVLERLSNINVFKPLSDEKDHKETP